MPNLSLYINSRFNPFSYEEMLAPALMATQAHQAIEEEYSNLNTKANAIGSLANEASDPITYARYKSYEEALRSQADDLAANGLNVTSRQNMLNLRNRYAKEMVPIQNAIERRRKLADEQLKQRAANPTIMYQRDFNTKSYDTSLDRFLENPDYGYGDVTSGALITQQAATQAGALAKKLSKISKGSLDAYTNTFIQQYGLSPAEIAAFNANPRDPKANRVLRAIYDNVYNTVPESIRSQYATDVDSYIGMGLYSAIGEDRFGTYENYGARLAAREAMQIRAEQRAAKRQEQANLKKVAINPVNIYSNKELSEKDKNYLAHLKAYSKYFYKENGEWKMNHAGWKEFNRKIPKTSGRTITTPEGTTINVDVKTVYTDSPFKKWMTSLGLKGISSKNFGPWQRKTAGALFGKYAETSPEAQTTAYDATKATEFDYGIVDSQQDSAKEAIMSANRGLTLKEVDYDSKTGKYENTGEELSMEDLNSDKYKVVRTRMSSFGNTVLIKDDKGNVRRFRMPVGINPANEFNRDVRMQWASVLQANRNGGTIRIPDDYARAMGIPIGTTINATPEQVQQEYERTIQEAYLFQSQLFGQNKTKEQEFDNYGY